MIKYRPEIDSLRAIAVFLVVFFHLDLFNFKGGFIGVDIFFVISGYLITSLIIADIDKNNFSFLDFYERRFRRIIPALYAVIILTFCIGFFLFSGEHFERLSQSTLYSSLAVSNIFFWSESGYFDFEKLFKPLLHTWSLSVELQFYVIWPFLIFLITKFFKKYSIIIILSIIILSLFLSTIFSHRSDGYFYFTLFRFYEFLIGALACFFSFKLKDKYNDLLFLVSLALLLFFSFYFSYESVFPGINALVPCILVLVIIQVSQNLSLFKKFFVNESFVFLGKISYSIYLIHWPLLIFYRYVNLKPLIFYEKIIILVITILLSYFSYRYIEIPFRRRSRSIFLLPIKKVLILFIFSLATVSVATLSLNESFQSYKLSEKKIKKLDEVKSGRQIVKDYEFNAKKRINDKNIFKDNTKNKVLVVGDSHALDFYSALKIDNNFEKFDFEYLEHLNLHCFNKKDKFDDIANQIKQITFSFNSCENRIKNFENYYAIDKADLIIISSRWKKNLDLQKLKEFFNNLTNKRLIIVGRRPSFYDIPTLFLKSKNNLNSLAYLNKDNQVNLINQQIEIESKKNNLVFYNLEKIICKTRSCTVSDKNSLFFHDKDHWSEKGLKFFRKELIKDNFFKLMNQNLNE